jgi:LmbE family N-acetylglucosaminyl deacetylase
MTADGGVKRVLVIVAHPDDAEVHAGGTLARWVDEGRRVHLIVATSGDKGHDDPAITREGVVRLRRAEQETAARILGVQRVTFLDYEDGELAWAGPRLAEEITRLIRQERPDTVMSLDPYAGAPRYATYQLHPDHRAVGFAVIDAVYFRAPGPLYYPAHHTEGLRPHRVGECLLMMGDELDYFVDIAATFTRKLDAVRAHTSQWGRHRDLEGMLRARAERMGQPRGFPLAEGFKRLLPG